MTFLKPSCQSINRIRLEFKGDIEYQESVESSVLIESDWNLKLLLPRFRSIPGEY